MKSFSKAGSGKRAPNIIFMFLAVLAAGSMWYFITVHDKLETQIEVRFDYTKIPPNLVVTSGLADKVKIRLRGPEKLIRSIPGELLNRSIDLSSIKKGKNSVPVLGEIESKYRAYDIIDTEPSKLEITADNLAERSVPVQPKFVSPLGENAIKVDNQSVNPSSVTVRGPESEIAKISSLPIIVHIDSKVTGRGQDTVVLETPSLVTASPPAVRVNYIITSDRKVIPRVCNIRVQGDKTGNYKVDPASVSLLLEVPESLANDEKYLSQVDLSVMNPDLQINESKEMKLRISLPEGMSLINPIAENIDVTRIK